MIDLPIADESSLLELHPRIILYNRILLIVNFLTLLALSVIIQTNLMMLYQIGSIFTILIILIVYAILVLDLYNGIMIARRKGTIEFTIQTYLLPVLLDIPLIFGFGLGIFRLFLRIVVYGALNPESKYYDEQDPLFT